MKNRANARLDLRMVMAGLLMLVMANLLHDMLPDARSWAERRLDLRFKTGHVTHSRLLQLASLGHQGLLADLLLIRAVLGFGEMEFQHDRLIENITWFHNILDTVTDLDPDFRSAYVLGGGILALRDKEDYRLANRFLKDVALKKWDSWQVPAWIGFNHYYMKEYEASLPWFRLALEKGAPSSYSAYLLATTKLGEDREMKTAIEVMRDYLMSIDDTQTRAYLELRLQRMVAIQNIREAAKQFRDSMGRAPTTLEELVREDRLSAETFALFSEYRIVFDNGQFRTFLKEQLASAR
ncbi:MAG: hypothetical protein GY807_07830 [Gammaproteobacteria bacterium]|nr:hypothetical protein [Gammaproteobacteria bacterium]